MVVSLYMIVLLEKGDKGENCETYEDIQRWRHTTKQATNFKNEDDKQVNPFRGDDSQDLSKDEDKSGLGE